MGKCWHGGANSVFSGMFRDFGERIAKVGVVLFVVVWCPVVSVGGETMEVFVTERSVAFLREGIMFVDMSGFEALLDPDVEVVRYVIVDGREGNIYIVRKWSMV